MSISDEMALAVYFDSLFEIFHPDCSETFLRSIEDIHFGKSHIKEIDTLCKDIGEKLLQSPCLLNISGGVNICGDIHGQFRDLLLLFRHGGRPSKTNQYLFLGDYVDRGKQSLETILFLYFLKQRYPDYIHLLRGNHESASITMIYGFFEECRTRLPYQGVKTWKTITDSFNRLPIAALVGGRIFCAHGGISPELFDLSQINMIMRPTDIHETGIMCDLLWSDPNPDADGWEVNERGVSFKFGKDVVEEFCKQFDVDLICRAHQVVEDGYEFFADMKLVTVFSAPNYGGDFTNAAAMIRVSEDLTCSIAKMNVLSNIIKDSRSPKGQRIVEGRSGSKSIVEATTTKKQSTYPYQSSYQHAPTNNNNRSSGYNVLHYHDASGTI